MKWQPIDTHPGYASTLVSLFWLEPLPPDEQPRFEKGDEPVNFTLEYERRFHKGRYGSWSSLCRATHWLPLAPP